MIGLEGLPGEYSACAMVKGGESGEGTWVYDVGRDFDCKDGKVG